MLLSFDSNVASALRSWPYALNLRLIPGFALGEADQRLPLDCDELAHEARDVQSGAETGRADHAI